MKIGNADDTDRLRFVDPSVDPSILWEISEFLAEIGLGELIMRIIRMLRRFPTVEYAVGFDGTDDWISIDDLDIKGNGIEVETKIWISQSNQHHHLLDFENTDGESILQLIDTQDENTGIKAIHNDSDDIQKVPLSRIESETWHDLRIWSDGNIFSVEVDGNQISIMSDVDLEDGPFKFYFGTSCHRFRYFTGMVKQLHVQSGSNQLFNLQAEKDYKIENKNDSAQIVGIHSMKKGRFEKEFTE